MRPQNDQITWTTPYACTNHQALNKSFIHELAFLSNDEASVCVLRDDLLHPPFSGSKHRKYVGLFEYIIKSDYKTILIPGSLGSNHFVTSIYIAKKLGLNVIGFSKKPKTDLNHNSLAAIQLLKNDTLIFCENPMNEAEQYLANTNDAFLMPLGGFCSHAFTSALSLGYDIMHENKKRAIDHVYLDAGTGLQAAACVFAMEEKGFKGKVTIIRMGKLDFAQVIDQISGWTSKKKPTFLIEVIPPRAGKMYASFHADVNNFMDDFFKETGIRLDHVYSGKLFYTLACHIREKSISGRILALHSGGIYSGTISE